MKRFTKKRFTLIAFVFAAALAMTACTGDLSTSIWAAPPLVQVEGAIGLPDGVYSGVGTGGFGGNIYVDVTVGGNAITDITVTAHNESQLFADQVFSRLIPEIMARQSTGVDTIAGATETFNALVAAVEDALVTGGADLASLREGPPVAAPAGGQAAGGASELGPFMPGTFEGIGIGGYYGDIHVAVTFDASRILALEVTHSDDTPMFANMAFSALIPRVLQAQTYDVDIVSGATYTSDAFLNAIMDAVDQATEW